MNETHVQIANRRISLDLLAVILLIALWALFFWRILTPVDADTVSFTQGDFSGQFFTFAGYQYERFATGEVPLWNPYNNGGLPFIADTQAAVFYPPRLITLAIAHLTGGWSYLALEFEVVAHVLAYTLLMYAFVRRMTGSPFGGLAAALIAGYGGFLTGYPLLQLAILEAGAWLPVATLGIYEATANRTEIDAKTQRRKDDVAAQAANGGGERIRWRYLALTGFALGMSWLAGHPQTSFFLTYLLVAYFGFRIYQRRVSISAWVIGCAAFGLISIGLAAVQLLPGVEYLSHTTRIDFGFDAKDNGFPLQDIIQFLLPGVVSQWSPLYVGVAGIIFALIGIWRRWREAWFWSAVALLALLWSFGGNAAVFPALYNLLPGLRFFRGQERAAFLVANALAILAGVGLAALANWNAEREHMAGLRLRLTLNRVMSAVLVLAALIFVSWIGSPDAYGKTLSMVALAGAVIVVAYILISSATTQEKRLLLIGGLVTVLVFELFTVGMNFDPVYDPVLPAEQVSTTPPPLIAAALEDTDGVFRVDGLRGLTDNYGSLYGLQDIRGISPLWMAEPYAIIEGEMPDEKAWDVFAVRYVYTDWAELPVASEIVASGTDRYGAVNLHRLTDSRPFALLLHDVWTVASPDEAFGVLREATFNPRRTIILQDAVSLDVGESAPAQIVTFEPEYIVIQADSAGTSALSIALPYYPGWSATLDGQPVDLLRAYGALSAVIVPDGSHRIELLYNPLTYQIGAVLSLITLLGLIGFGIFTLFRSFSRHGDTQSAPEMGRAG